MSKKKSNSRPSLSEIRKVLADCAQDPRKPGPMSVIADVGSTYTLLRSAEFLNEIVLLLNTTKDENEIQVAVERAVSLLGYWLAQTARTKNWGGFPNFKNQTEPEPEPQSSKNQTA